ncbi:MAG: hypothetical protein M3N19_10400, partial [Candidatus Eremiobacteraeota bacterium]|nr:hypothetical protein [Candidatus Eremiobacteraeota bacterium]
MECFTTLLNDQHIGLPARIGLGIALIVAGGLLFIFASHMGDVVSHHGVRNTRPASLGILYIGSVVCVIAGILVVFNK